MTKPNLTLCVDPTDAKNLAKLYEKITGKRVSAAEIAAEQKKLDAARALLTRAETSRS